MLRRMMTTLGAGTCMMLLAPVVAHAQGNMPQAKEATITGTVIDVSCKFASGQSGAQHRQCAQICADAGVPLAILGDDGTLYIPVSMTGTMPGANQNTQLKPHAEHKVTVTGHVFDAGGAKAIHIMNIRM